MSTPSSVRAAIAHEIKIALCQGKPLSTPELLAACPSAQEALDVSRVLYDLRKAGQIGPAGQVTYTNKIGKQQPVTLHAWIGPPEATPAFSRASPVPETETAPRPGIDEPGAAEKAAMLDGTWSETGSYALTDTEREVLIEALAAKDTVLPVTAHGNGEYHGIPAVAAEEEQTMDALCERCMSRLDDTPLGEACDPTELALADLLDQADEAVLAYADSRLAEDRLWRRLRQLADDSHQALCDYRTLASRETNNA